MVHGLCDATPKRNGWLRLTSNPLNQHRNSHTTADAQSCQAALHLSPFHFMQQRGGNAHAGTADGMAQSNRTAINIQTILIKLQIAITGDDLCGKSLVKFDEIDIRQSEFLSLHDRARGGYRTYAHYLWRHADDLIIDQARLRFRTSFFQSRFA